MKLSNTVRDFVDRKAYVLTNSMRGRIISEAEDLVDDLMIIFQNKTYDMYGVDDANMSLDKLASTYGYDDVDMFIEDFDQEVANLTYESLCSHFLLVLVNHFKKNRVLTDEF